jgi:hypothetical protein
LLVDAERRLLARAPALGAPVCRRSAHPATLNRAGDMPSGRRGGGPGVPAGPSDVPTPGYGPTWMSDRADVVPAVRLDVIRAVST